MRTEAIGSGRTGSLIGSAERLAVGERSVTAAPRGMIATSHPLASQAGLAALRRGGTAVDAAVAAAAVLAVAEPHNSQLGGDAFMLVYQAKTGRVMAINASGPAPCGAEPAAFGSGGIPTRGLAAASVPGVVDGWETALRLFGRLTLADVLQDAIEYADRGFPLSIRESQMIAAEATVLSGFPSSAAVFLPDDMPPAPGARFRQPGLARTLRLIARNGADEFYRGSIADDLVKFSNANDGLFSLGDLAAYHAKVLDPVSTTYRGVTVYEQPPVSQGMILLEELNLVEGYDLAGMGRLSPETVHLLVEAKKLAFADRVAYVGDPAFAKSPVETLLSKEFAAARRASIDPRKARWPSAGDLPSPGLDTTYLAAADSEGNCVSFIQSVFHSFGCGVVVGETGVLLNNRLTGFSLDPTSPNYLVPGKKTMHTLNTFMLARDGRPWIVGGSPGGDYQVQTNLQVVTNLVDFGLSLQEAIESPRWGSNAGLEVVIEDRAPKATIDDLRRLGHQVVVQGPWGGSGRAQLIAVQDDGSYLGAGDPRWDYLVVGY